MVGFASIGAMFARCWSACTSDLIQGLHCVPLHQTPLVKFFFFKIFILCIFALLGKLYRTAGPWLNICQILNGTASWIELGQWGMPLCIWVGWFSFWVGAKPEMKFSCNCKALCCVLWAEDGPGMPATWILVSGIAVGLHCFRLWDRRRNQERKEGAQKRLVGKAPFKKTW